MKIGFYSHVYQEIAKFKFLKELIYLQGTLEEETTAVDTEMGTNSFLKGIVVLSCQIHLPKD